MSNTHPIIAVCGPPGSGKSAFAKALANALKAIVVDMDHYQTFTDERLDHIIANLSDVDVTDSDDFYSRFKIPQLGDDLRALKQGRSISLPPPLTTSKSSQERPETRSTQASGEIVFETHFGRAHPDSGQFIDFLIWLDCPLDIAMARKLGSFLTDFLASSEDAHEHREQMAWLNQYIQQYQTGVRSMLDIQSGAIAHSADFRLDARGSLDDMVTQTLSALDQWRANTNQHKGPSKALSAAQAHAYDYLCIEPFCQDFVQLQLLNSGFNCGLFNALESTPRSLETLLSHCDTDAQGLAFLLDSLQHHHVLEATGASSRSTSDTSPQQESTHFQFTPRFRAAYGFKDLLQAKIVFSNFLAPDLLHNMGSFVRSEQEFMGESQLFELFDYQRATEHSEENYQFTKRWMDLTTTLTRYEAGVCIAHVDFSHYSRVMDIGGNSGEFVRQICQTQPQIQATVVDLPVVCEVGKAHLRETAEASRVEFYPANALVDALPGHQCVVSFKSILHDWPIDACERFITQASKALRKGGEIIIFERSKLDLQANPMTYGTLSTAMFYRSYRCAEDYRALLSAAGLSDITIEKLPLETEFHLIRARKA
ncbi:MAG: methyltransferase [Cellvibrionaceae bacterium]